MCCWFAELILDGFAHLWVCSVLIRVVCVYPCACVHGEVSAVCCRAGAEHSLVPAAATLPSSYMEKVVKLQLG